MSRPYVVTFSTVTLDGRLASKEGYSRLSCEFDKVRQHRLRSEVDAVIVGGGTVREDDPLLTVRLVKAESYPTKVIVSNSLDLSPRPQGVRHAAGHDRLFGLKGVRGQERLGYRSPTRSAKKVRTILLPIRSDVA